MSSLIHGYKSSQTLRAFIDLHILLLLCRIDDLQSSLAVSKQAPVMMFPTCCGATIVVMIMLACYLDSMPRHSKRGRRHRD